MHRLVADHPEPVSVMQQALQREFQRIVPKPTAGPGWIVVARIYVMKPTRPALPKLGDSLS